MLYVKDGKMVNLDKSFPIFKPKPFDQMAGVKFSVPEMRTKSGDVVPIVLTNASLDVRAPTAIPPQPLHDPMENHTIVLYDPTLDKRGTDEECTSRRKTT
jgi:DNA repair and recombination RAD54-like protein